MNKSWTPIIVPSVSYKPRMDMSMNRPNPKLAIKGNHDQGNNRNQALDSAFDTGTAEAQQDPNVMTSNFFFHRSYSTVIFDFNAYFSFISTDFFPLINSKLSVVNPDYEIEIASGLKVVANMIVRASELKLEDRPNVRNFPSVFPEDLPGLPSFRKVEFCTYLVPEAMPIAKSPYRLAPTEMQELSNQLKELQDKGFIRPSFSPRRAPCCLLRRRMKNKKFNWDEEQENAFQTLKDMLCDALILALPKGTNNFGVYFDASNQGKANVVADALSRKEWMKPR
nr:putative reverse transcriptase domain-containing protein [Tanacetum cinerariifolium]